MRRTSEPPSADRSHNYSVLMPPKPRIVGATYNTIFIARVTFAEVTDCWFVKVLIMHPTALMSEALLLNADWNHRQAE